MHRPILSSPIVQLQPKVSHIPSGLIGLGGLLNSEVNRNGQITIESDSIDLVHVTKKFQRVWHLIDFIIIPTKLVRRDLLQIILVWWTMSGSLQICCSIDQVCLLNFEVINSGLVSQLGWHFNVNAKTLSRYLSRLSDITTFENWSFRISLELVEELGLKKVFFMWYLSWLDNLGHPLCLVWSSFFLGQLLINLWGILPWEWLLSCWDMVVFKFGHHGKKILLLLFHLFEFLR